MYLYIHFLVFIKVADWTSALLDAHFTQFLLSYEARELLFELADAVKYQVSKNVIQREKNPFIPLDEEKQL